MITKVIKSLANPLVKQVVTLHERKGRALHKRCIVEGKRAIATCLSGKMKPCFIFVTEQTHAFVMGLSAFSDVMTVSDKVMKKISPSISPCGILAVFEIPEQLSLDHIGPGVVLAQIQDPGNMGTLIRTAAALNKRSFVLVEGVDPWSPKVIQASAGTVALVDIFQVRWQDLVACKKTVRLCALVVSGGRHPNDVAMADSLLVVGSEALGLPKEWIDTCDDTMTLPMPGSTESLNAAVAGSIALYWAHLQGKQ